MEETDGLPPDAHCRGGGVPRRERPEHLAEAEARFAVLEDAFDHWARRGVVAAPSEEEQPEEAAFSGSACSCTDSCFGFDIMTCGQEATSDAERKPVEMTPGATAARVNAERDPATTHKSAPAAVTPRPRRGWSRSAACCGAAGAVAVAVVALAVGVAVEFATVAHQTFTLFQRKRMCLSLI
ncbi:hypothetical protein GUJ93_ZPchr2177g28964 [Zizania palustris]|uniref:Uncharacterized protein n=1 Tax=Zizania palustris TaxID=103762 RepID=A0A8J5VB40_ZIZPA|nr:hypothetical protein GUJ93_ZPchr2177g28964 [Zizania palustris]